MATFIDIRRLSTSHTEEGLAHACAARLNKSLSTQPTYLRTSTSSPPYIQRQICQILHHVSSSVWPDGYIIFFNIWPFVTMTVCPIALKNAQIGFNILLNNKEILKQLSKTFKMLSIWWNFTKSGHTFWQVLGDPFKRFEVSLSSAKYFQTKWSPLSDKFSRLQLMTSKYFKFSCWHLLADTGFRHFCKSILKWRVVTETPTQKFVFRIEKTPGN